MNLDKLKHYRLDPAFIDGVIITLDEAPDAEFLIRLPCKYNRAFTSEIIGAFEIPMPDDAAEAATEKANEAGDAKDDKGPESVNPTAQVAAFLDRRREAFVRHCIVSMDGEPIDPDQLERECPEVVDQLLEKADAMAKALQEGADAAKKKSAPTSPGTTPGESG